MNLRLIETVLYGLAGLLICWIAYGAFTTEQFTYPLITMIAPLLVVAGVIVGVTRKNKRVE